MFCYALQLRESIRMFYFRDISTCAVNVCDLVTFRSYVKHYIIYIFGGRKILLQWLMLRLLQCALYAAAFEAAVGSECSGPYADWGLLVEACYPSTSQALHWLPASFLVKHKVRELTPKMLHDLAPSYVHDVIFSLELAWPVWEKLISTAKLHGGEGDWD